MGLTNVHGVAGLYRRARREVHGRVLDGKALAADIRQALKESLAASSRPAPGLATVLVGDDPASAIYVASKHRACQEVGIASFDRQLPAGATQEDLEECLAELVADSRVSGILLQRPLVDGLDARAALERIGPEKDVDGLTWRSAGRLATGSAALVPCTPAGIMTILDHYGIEIEGRRAVVVGRSNLVGRPVASLLEQRNATVTICHSRTRALAHHCQEADILIAAAGKPRLIGPEHVKPGAVVIDVGIHRTDDGLCGDVVLETVQDKVAAITPVPGGVGPMTIASLLVNTVQAHHQQAAAVAEVERDRRG